MNTAAYDPDTAFFAGGGLYPGAGDTIGLTATSGYGAPNPSGVSGAVTPGATLNMFQGNPIMGAIIFIVLIIVVMLLVRHFGEGSEGGGVGFANVKGNAWNAFIVSGLAAAGIPLWKTGAGTLATMGIPGANHVFQYLQGS